MSIILCHRECFCESYPMTPTTYPLMEYPISKKSIHNKEKGFMEEITVCQGLRNGEKYVACRKIVNLDR